MNATQILLVAVAGVLAGAINAIAGGGTLISFPALLAIGMPPVAANITSRVGLVSSYAGGAMGYRRELAEQGRRVRALAGVAIAGGAAGAVILLVTPARSFRVVVPYLILLSCLLLLVQPTVGAWLAARRARTAVAAPGHPGAPESESGLSPLVHAGVFVSAAYASYFGAGVGVLLLAILGILLNEDIQRLNGLKNVLILVANVIGVLIFLISGQVHWLAAGVLLATSYGGGLIGSRLARRLKPAVLRLSVIALGVVVAVALVVTG